MASQKSYCSEHCEIKHDIYGDGLNKKGVLAEFKDVIEKLNAAINKRLVRLESAYFISLGGLAVFNFIVATYIALNKK